MTCIISAALLADVDGMVHPWPLHSRSRLYSQNKDQPVVLLMIIFATVALPSAAKWLTIVVRLEPRAVQTFTKMSSMSDGVEAYGN